MHSTCKVNLVPYYNGDKSYVLFGLQGGHDLNDFKLDIRKVDQALERLIAI